jgi:hypothetical protein
MLPVSGLLLEVPETAMAEAQIDNRQSQIVNPFELRLF